MFSVLFLINLVPVISMLDKNLTNIEDSTVLRVRSNNPNLLNEFLRYHNMSKENIDRIKNRAYVTDDYASIWVAISYLPHNIMQNQPAEILDLIDYLLPVPKSSALYSAGPRAVIHGNFQYMINYLSIERYENKDWVLRMWHPFQNNVVGLAAYKNDEDGYEIVEIYNNQTENDIPKHNLILAGYIPKEILNEIKRNKSRDELLDLRIRMVLIFNGGKFKELWKIDGDVQYFIGVNIPGYCKGNHIPFLKGYFRNEDWVEMGGKYIDDTPGISKQFCLLSQMVFFGRMQNDYLDSVNENYCVDSDTGLLATSIAWWSDTKICMYKEPCFDKFRIDNFLCSRNNKPFRCKVDNCPNDIKFPNRTKSYYDILRFCTFMSANSYCNESFAGVIDGVTSYYDFLIAVDMFYKTLPLSWESIQYDPKIFQDLMARGLSHLEKDFEDHQITAISSLIISMAGYYNSYDIFSNSRITSLIFSFNTKALGFIIFKSNTSSIGYDVKLLTVNNATLDYARDDNVNIIAYVTKFNKKLYSTCHLFVFHGNFIEYKNQTTKSDVISVHCPEDIIVLNLFLRSKHVENQNRKEYYSNEGYSSKVNIKKNRLTMVYVFELKNPVCDPVSKLMIFDRLFENKDFNSIHFGNIITRNIDLLSYIASTVNEDTQETHLDQSTILKSLTFILSSLSLIGISCIFLSALFLKDWYQQRPYSIQLTISVAGETVFFLISEGYITQIGYIVFYYFLLSQFIWMLIIGYLQYIRYVKVFEAYELDLVKTSLIGWILPILITSISILAHLECLQCNFCSKNREILLHFFIIPISIIVVSNTGLYAYVLVMIARSGTEHFDPDAQKARRKATIFLPPILGITWVFFGMLFVPNLAVSIIGSYIFHIIASSQGLMVFIFVIVLDKSTLMEWYVKFVRIFRPNNTSMGIALNTSE